MANSNKHEPIFLFDSVAIKNECMASNKAHAIFDFHNSLEMIEIIIPDIYHSIGLTNNQNFLLNILSDKPMSSLFELLHYTNRLLLPAKWNCLDKISLELYLRATKLFDDYLAMLNLFRKKIHEAIALLNDNTDQMIIKEKDFQHYPFGKLHNAPFIYEPYQEINEDSLNDLNESAASVMYCFDDFLKKESQIIFKLMFSIKAIFIDAIDFNLNQKKIIFEKHIKTYSSIYHKDHYDIIRKDIIASKNNDTRTLTPDDWDDYLKIEKSIISLAADGKLTSKKATHSFFDADTIRLMNRSQDMMKLILDGFFDDDIFDLNHSFDKNENLINSITEDNYHLFDNLVLRGNIIRYGIRPNLNTRFDLWYNGRDGANDCTNDDTAINRLKSKWAEVCFYDLQQNGYVDENFKPRCSINKASVIAYAMINASEGKVRWKDFENFWGIPNLAHALAMAKPKKYYANLYKTIIYIVK